MIYRGRKDEDRKLTKFSFYPLLSAETLGTDSSAMPFMFPGMVELVVGRSQSCLISTEFADS